MYKYKQDLAMAYFPDHSKESASKRFAHEIHSNKHLTISLIQRLPQKIFIFLVTFSLFLQLIIIEGHPTHPPDRALHDSETKHKMKGQKMD